MKINIKQIDVFTTIPFEGNPAGVVTNANKLSQAEKQKIAKEMNLSETAFVSDSEAADFKVEFFSPNLELDFAGHPTIATFSALNRENRLDPAKKIFYQETKAGIIPVELLNIQDRNMFMVTMKKPKFEKCKIGREEIAQILKLNQNDLIDTPVMRVFTGIYWLVVGIKNLGKLSGLNPDFDAIKVLSEKYRSVGIIPFCMETFYSSYDFHTRAFAPAAGVNEDPVCGTGNSSAASFIVHNRLINIDHEIKLVGEQGHEVGRPGTVYINMEIGNSDITKIKIGGEAITILEGILSF